MGGPFLWKLETSVCILSHSELKFIKKVGAGKGTEPFISIPIGFEKSGSCPKEKIVPIIEAVLLKNVISKTVDH